jgi:lipid II:glycine glycyltransferase (peptidoglycan interpeptide bridge formation enzyme)
VGLVLYRRLPKVKRSLAYLPEGPVIDWSADPLAEWLDPMVEHLKGQGAFGVRMGPPVVVRRWDAASVKQGVADDAVRRLDDVAPTAREPQGAAVVSQLRELGWLPQTAEGGFAAGQPQFVFQIPLRHPDGTARTEDEVLKGMNQLWRRNIKKATKEGVVAERVPADRLEAELDRFHELYVHTARRDHFTPRPKAYFTTMFRALGAEDPDRIALFHGEHEGDLVASTVLVQVGGHVWYSYGASSSEKREVRGSNAVQWAMIRHALKQGADVYDLRGITDTLDPEDSHVGLIQFKVGTGGEAVEYAGEWDRPINRLLYKAFALYMARRR